MEKEGKSISEDETCTNLNMTRNTIGLRPNVKKGKAKDKDLPYPDYMLGVECNSLKPKDFKQVVLKAIIVECVLEGKQVRALLDTGSLSDFISTIIVDQMKLEAAHLSKPIVCQMAPSRSRTMITSCVDAHLQFQGIDETCRFDVINLENHDLILGTPFLWQPKVIIGFNPAKVVIGSLDSLALY